MNSASFIVTEADQCVKCGLCLPHCPTYRLLRNEADSPRGRIALMQGLAQGQLEPDPQLFTHLDRCLGCRACEKACPSGVHYGQLLDTTRDWGESRRRRPWFQRHLRRMALALAGNPDAWHRVWQLLGFYQRSGLRALLTASGLLRLFGLRDLDRQLPPLHATAKRPAATPASASHPQARIGLLSGCMEDIVSATLHRDVTALLERLGYQVVQPAEQYCCGALHQHNGDLAGARRLAQTNCAAFAAQNLDTVLYLSSGCGTTLMDYPALLPDQAAGGDPIPAFIEATTFLARHEALEQIEFKPLAAGVAWLSPCSQRNRTGGTLPGRQLLERIPDIRLIALNHDCCGAAGSYMLSQPAIATALRDEVLHILESTSPDYLVTANAGCALHLANGLRQRGQALEVIHPLTLLARQLKKD